MQVLAFVLSLPLLLSASPCIATDEEAVFAAGQQAYQDGNYEKALELLRPLSESGSRFASLLVLLATDELEKEKAALANPTMESAVHSFDNRRYDAAFRLFHPFAEQGNAEALMYLGLIKQRQIGREPEAAEAALPYFEQAADRGLAYGQFFAAIAISIARPPDWLEKFERWITLAAQSSIDRAYLPMRWFLCSKGEADLADSWSAIDSADPGFRAPPEEFDSRWNEIRDHWELHRCGKSKEVTKDFVRAV
ncbi:MAG: hypothetical protein RLN99_19515, partial [Kiloniellaceae bacterium]